MLLPANRDASGSAKNRSRSAGRADRTGRALSKPTSSEVSQAMARGRSYDPERGVASAPDLTGLAARIESPKMMPPLRRALPSPLSAAVPTASLSVQFAATLASVWLLIQILTAFPSLFMLFLYPILLAAILEPMKMSLWQFFWALSLSFARVVYKWFQLAGCVVSKKVTYEPLSAESLNEGLWATPTLAMAEEGDSYTSTGKAATRPRNRASVSDSVGIGRRASIQDSAAAVRVVSSTALWYLELGFKKFLLVVSIVLCLAVAGRVLMIIGQIVIHSAEQIACDFDHYEKGATLRIVQLKEWIASMVEAKFGRRIEVPVDILFATGKQLLQYVKQMGISVSAYVVQQVVPSTCITTLFLIFLMWNPVKADGTKKEIIELCFDFVKVKSGLSILLGFLVGFSLKMCGLELYYAAGLLVAVANFIPNGALLCSIFPCVFALFDDRKVLSQVVTSLIIEISLINCFAFIVEPLFFGAAIEMHPIPAILGVTFFGYIWGVPGMLISIPILGASRLALAAYASKASNDGEMALFRGLQDFFEGKWTTTATMMEEEFEEAGDLEMELGEIRANEAGVIGITAPGAPVLSSETRAEPQPLTPLTPPVQQPLEFMATNTDDEHSAVYEEYNKLVACLRAQYDAHKVWIDGICYVLAVYFLFSSWSDRVFGIYGDPGAVAAALERDSSSVASTTTLAIAVEEHVQNLALMAKLENKSLLASASLMAGKKASA